MSTTRFIPLSVVMTLAASCGVNPSHDSALNATPGVSDVTVQSALPADRLAKVKAALPKVAFPKLQEILESPQTFWYDHDSMTPSYQAAISQSPPMGANSNDRWFDLIADSVEPTARNFYNENTKRWRFPFGTTAGTDNATNMKVFNFLWLPAKNGKLLPVTTYTTTTPTSAFGGFSLNSWGWTYPNGAMLGELIFVNGAGGELLPSEIRIRTRYNNGWSVNAFRPFPKARALSAAIKAKRPNYASNATLNTLVTQLENNGSLTAKSLKAPNLPKTFDEDGALDVLPEFGDDALVKELLTSTTFVSTYGTVWKAGNGRVAHAAGSSATLSIVPKNYEAGVIAVNEDSCMRCHKETGKGLTSFSSSFSDIVLYGEMWGRDGIFSFHPFDESRYNVFWLAGTQDNRRQNPKLVQQGIIASYNAQAHKAPVYPEKEAGLGKGNIAGKSNGGGTVDPNLGGGNNGGGNNGGNDGGDDGTTTSTDTGTGTDTGGGTQSNIVEFRIKAGTGSGEWNLQNAPVVVKRGQIVRIFNDDQTSHVLHTNGDPCPHGPVGNPFKKGQFHDCVIDSNAQVGTYRTWDHFLGDPNSGRFWIKVVQ